MIERIKEQERTEGTDNNRFWNSRLSKHRKRGEIKNGVMYSSCLHDQQDLCWGNTSRDTSEELQEPRIRITKQFPFVAMPVVIFWITPY